MSAIYKTVSNKPKIAKPITIAIGAIISILLLGVGWYLVQGSSIRASDDEPRDVVVTNITGNSARVEWTTGQSTQGVIEYGTAEEALVFFAPETQQGLTHAVDLTLLTPATTHYFQIKIGDKAYTNGGTGKPWQFTTRTKDGQIVVPTGAKSQEATPSASPTISSAPSSSSTDTIPTLFPTNKPTIAPTLTIPPNTPTQTVIIPTATPIPLACNEVDCLRIKQKLGLGCTATDYIRCLNKNGVTVQPSLTPTNTLTPTPKQSVLLNSECQLSGLQATNCRTWTWKSMTQNPQACRNAFYKYVFMCKNISYIPTPGVNTQEIRYFDGSITDIASSSATIPGLNFPTPVVGSTVYCAVRGEEIEGGNTRATSWVFGSSNCSN